MTIAREEIFGPVLVDHRLRGRGRRGAHRQRHRLRPLRLRLRATLDRARSDGPRIRTGNVHLNGAGPDFNAPFGGYKQSGNGREWGEFGFEEFLETKAIIGYAAKA